MRIVEPDGSITDDCPKCSGSGISRNAGVEGAPDHTKCDCKDGKIIIAIAGSVKKEDE